MEHAGSLPHSQEPATSPYTEPNQSSPYPHPTTRTWILILSSHLRLGFPSDLFLSRFPQQNSVRLSPVSHTWHIPTPSILLLTYLLTPWSTVLHEKPKGPQLVRNFPAFYGARRFITAFKTARHLSISWARWIQLIPAIPRFEYSFYYLRLGTPCTGGWVGPGTGLSGCWKSRPPPGFDPRTVQSLYQLNQPVPIRLAVLHEIFLCGAV
jgi:hypothetical protein